MRSLLAAALIGVVHVHHAPSHDSAAPFEEVLRGAQQAALDFVVLTEHAPEDAQSGPLPAWERRGLVELPDGRPLLVLVGVEFATADGHLLALDVPELVPASGRPARDVIADVHSLGGFAVVPHPFTHGGWRDWSAPFDGMEVHNNASAFQRFRASHPLWLLRVLWDRRGSWERMLRRPDRELERWEELLRDGRKVVGFSGADAHRNVSLFGWRLDPYGDLFSAVQTRCPGIRLREPDVWSALRSGRCSVRYTLFSRREAESRELRFPSGRVEVQLEGGERVLEIRNPIIAAE